MLTSGCAWRHLPPSFGVTVRCGAKTQCGICDLVFLCGWLGCAPVLIDQSAEYSVALDRGVEGDHGGRIVGRWVLVKPLVRPVVIEMTHVLVQDGLCVSFVVDQHPVGAFGADAADKSFRVAVCPGRMGRIFTTVIFSEAKTASKASVNLASRSRIRNRNALIPSSRSCGCRIGHPAKPSTSVTHRCRHPGERDRRTMDRHCGPRAARSDANPQPAPA